MVSPDRVHGAYSKCYERRGIYPHPPHTSNV